MNIFEDINIYYETSIDLEPDVKREWVDGYLRHEKSHGASDIKLRSIWSDIQSFMFYQGRSEHHDLSKIPYWEYSVCLEWMQGHILSKDYELNFKNAKRFLGNILVFCKFLAEKGYIANCAEIEKAYSEICGGKKLNLVSRIPYTGTEEYTAISVPTKTGRADATFTMSDYWLIILYMSSKMSWQHLIEVAKSVPKSEKKTVQIRTLRAKLKNIGYLVHPEALMRPYGPPTNDDMDDASRWFFNK